MTGRNLRSQPWRLLSGLQQPEFGLQPELCLFQIKYWLTGVDDIRTAFSKATAMFTLYEFENGIKDFGRADFAWRMTELLKNPTYAQLFNESFARGKFLDLLGIDSLKNEVEWRAAHRQHADFEIHFALCRLAFIEQKEDDRLFAAEIYMEKERPKDVIGLSVSERFRDYRDKAAFLLAAHWTLPTLLDFNDDVLLRLRAEVPDPGTFRVFCMQVRAVASRLQSYGDEQLLRWTGLEPLSLPQLPEIPLEVLAKWSNTFDRPAEETKVGKAGRQKPVTETR